MGDAGNRTPASPQPHPVYNQDTIVTGQTSTTTTVQRMRDSIMDNCRLHMICIFLFSSGAGRDSIVTGQYAANPLVHVVVGAARMHCSLTGQPERVPARNPQHAGLESTISSLSCIVGAARVSVSGQKQCASCIASSPAPPHLPGAALCPSGEAGLAGQRV